MIQDIVKQATELKNKHVGDRQERVNYACIFSQSQEEYHDLVGSANNIGKVIQEMANGFLFHIDPLETVSGPLKLLKIRMPDVTRPERGDADFTVTDYAAFKSTYISQQGFKLMKKREDFEMLELMDPAFTVRAYFSDPPLDKQLGIN